MIGPKLNRKAAAKIAAAAEAKAALDAARAARPPKAPGANCHECPAYSGRMLPPIPAPSGKTRLAVVGEAPCASDLREGRVFESSGASMLRRGLLHNGVRLANVHWTNAVLCDCRFKHRKAAATACASRLKAELNAVSPDVILPLDSLPTSVVLDRRSTPIQKWRGSVSVLPNGEGYSTFVIPAMHPAEVRKAPKWGPTLEVDVARAARVMRDGWMPPEETEGRRIIVTKTIEELEHGLQLLSQSYYIGFDVETVGLGPTETDLVCFGIGDDRIAVVVPWASRDGRALWWADGGAEVARRITAFLKDRVTVTHNGPSFDHIVGARYGIHIGAWDDTLLMTHNTSSHLPKGLGFVVTQHIDVGPWKLLEDRKAELELLWRYNGRDVLYMMLAYHAMRDARPEIFNAADALESTSNAQGE